MMYVAIAFVGPCRQPRPRTTGTMWRKQRRLTRRGAKPHVSHRPIPRKSETTLRVPLEHSGERTGDHTASGSPPRETVRSRQFSGIGERTTAGSNDFWDRPQCLPPRALSRRSIPWLVLRRYRLITRGRRTLQKALARKRDAEARHSFV